MPVGVTALVLSACVDRCFYKRWELVPWNFFKFNVLAGGSAAGAYTRSLFCST